jgi:hypothetical protein
MTQTVILLLASAALTGPSSGPSDAAKARAIRRHHEYRMARRFEANPDTFNPNFGKGWAGEGSTPTFGGEEFNPVAQRPHPGLPPKANNRLRLSYSHRMEHWQRGDNPLSRMTWNSPVMP